MSRNCELFAGGSNGFEIKDIEGYKKWKSSLVDDFQDLLHEEKSKDSFTVYVGEKYEDSKDMDDLDTYINHFHPDGDGWDNGTPAEFWCGLSLFVKDPIELFQTDEEFPHLSKVFGAGDNDDEGMFRLWAFEGKVIVQRLKFKVASTVKYNAKDMLDEEVLAFVKSKKDAFCDKCKAMLNPIKFNFETRGYYNEVKEKTGYKHLCQDCYAELKKPFAEIKRLEGDIQVRQEELRRLKDPEWKTK